MRAVRPDGVPTVWVDGADSMARPWAAALLSVDGTPYRGELDVRPAATAGFVVVNVVKIDDYLRGVVPLEIGDRSAAATRRRCRRRR